MNEVVVGIISKENEHSERAYLLVSSTKDFGQYTGYYYPPGGHMKPGESRKEALVRELREELGIGVNPVREIAETKGDVEDQITYWWDCNTTDNDIQINSKEIDDAGYFSKQAMSKLPLWPATKVFFNEYIFNST